MRARQRALGHPRARRLVGDAATSLVAWPVPTATIMLVVGIVCGVVLATTGRSAATEREILATVDSTGTRLIKVSDVSGEAGMAASNAQTLGGINGVSYVLGLGPVTDVHNAAWPGSGTGTPMRTAYGDTHDLLPVIAGRPAALGEALIGPEAAKALGLSSPAGGVASANRIGPRTSVPVVGMFQPDPALADLSRMVLLQGSQPQADTVRYLYIVTQDVADVDRVAQAVRAALAARTPQAATVETAESMLLMRDALSGTLTHGARVQMLLILTVGMVLVAVTQFSATVSRRRDFGRRRALGASRSAIMVLVIAHTAFASILGATGGTAVGIAVLVGTSGSTPGPGFVTGVGVVVVVSALVAAAPPALATALRDPATTLRVP